MTPPTNPVAGESTPGTLVIGGGPLTVMIAEHVSGQYKNLAVLGCRLFLEAARVSDQGAQG